MSDIPRAIEILKGGLRQRNCRKAIRRALRLMRRERPTFRHRAQYPPLDEAGERMARRLRRRGMSIRDIANRMGTSYNRASTAINRFRKKHHS